MSAHAHMLAVDRWPSCPHDVLDDEGACEDCGLSRDEQLGEAHWEVAMCLLLQPDRE